MATNYRAEIDALQRFIYAAAGLKSARQSANSTPVARPLVLFGPPQRLKDRQLSDLVYVTRVVQYATLQVTSLDELVDAQEALISDLQSRGSVLPVYADDTANAAQVSTLKRVEIEFDNDLSLDVPMRIRYEATYKTGDPTVYPAATKVTNRVQLEIKPE